MMKVEVGQYYKRRTPYTDGTPKIVKVVKIEGHSDIYYDTITFNSRATRQVSIAGSLPYRRFTYLYSYIPGYDSPLWRVVNK